MNFLFSSCVKAIVGLLILMLVACSSTEQYLEATTLPPIEVPDGLDDRALGQIYKVPEGDGRLASGEMQEPLPPTLLGRQKIIEPRVQNFADKSWVAVPKNAASTWSHLLIYLRSRKLDTVIQDPITATVDTTWMIEAAEPGTALRYRMRLEPGLHSSLTEIHVVNIKGSLQSRISRNTDWPEKSEDSSHEKWFLKDIARSLSAQKPLGDSLIASSISFPARAASTSIGTEPVISIDMDAGRTYATLVNAMGDDFNVFEASADEKLVYFKVNKDKKKKVNEKRSFREKLTGFLSRVSSGDILRGESVTDHEAPYSLEKMLNHLPQEPDVMNLFPGKTFGKKTLSKVPGFLLVQVAADGKQYVYVRDGYGRKLEPSKAKELLNTIKQNLY